MSHWMEGRVENLECSLDKMRVAIINIMPEWERHIETSTAGNIVLHSGYVGGTKTGFHIKVPETTPGVSYCDFGMRRATDGTWHIEYDPAGLPDAMRNAPDALKNEINAMRARMIAEQNDLQIIEDKRDRRGVKQRIRMTPNQIQDFVQQMQ